MSENRSYNPGGDRIVALVVDGEHARNAVGPNGLVWDGKSDLARAPSTNFQGNLEEEEDLLHVTYLPKEMCTCFESDNACDQEGALEVLAFSPATIMKGEEINFSTVKKPLCIHGNEIVAKKMGNLQRYKKAIIELCDKTLTFSDRFQKLNIAWESLAMLVRKSTPEASKNLFYWVLRHTLYLMLGGEWMKLSASKIHEIRKKIERSMLEIKTSPNTLNRCGYILQYLDNPWRDERLIAVVNGEPRILTQNDLDCLTAERGCMIVLRLQKLCETKCDDLAFKLCSKTLLALRSVNKNHDLRKSTSVGHIYFIFDIYLCFVHKYVGVYKFIEEVRRLGLYDALLLIRRNVNSEASSSRLMKLRDKVANLAANIIIATIMVENLNDDNAHLYCAIMKEWFRMHQRIPVKKFREIARRLFTTAISSKHLHLACVVIKQLNIDGFNELLLELYVRILTGELNELELLKSEKSCSAEVLIDNEVILSYRYLQIADLLQDTQPHLAHECILTAFSLHPTQVNYDLVKSVAYTKFKYNEAAFKNQLPNTSSFSEIRVAELDAVVNEEKLKLAEALNVPYKFIDHNYDASSIQLPTKETVNFANQIESDISVLLSSPRVKFLSWVQSWYELDINCQKLLRPGGKLEIVRQSLAVANDYLQFLNLDYNQFRDLPEIDGPGIEKGYEIFVNSDEDVSTNGSDEVSDENTRKKRSSKRQQRQIKRSKSPSHSASTHESAQSEERCEETLSNPKDNYFLFHQLQQEQMNNALDNAYLQQLLEDSQINLQDSLGSFHADVRKCYIQQLEAQFQLSKTYTAALQQQVSPMPFCRQAEASQQSRDVRKRPQASERTHTSLTVSKNVPVGASKSNRPSQKTSAKRNPDLDSHRKGYSQIKNIQSNPKPAEQLHLAGDTSVKELSNKTSAGDLTLSTGAPYFARPDTPLNLSTSESGNKNFTEDNSQFIKTNIGDKDLSKNCTSGAEMKGLISQFQIPTEFLDTGLIVEQKKETFSPQDLLISGFPQSSNSRKYDTPETCAEKPISQAPSINIKSSSEEEIATAKQLQILKKFLLSDKGIEDFGVISGKTAAVAEKSGTSINVVKLSVATDSKVVNKATAEASVSELKTKPRPERIPIPKINIVQPGDAYQYRRSKPKQSSKRPNDSSPSKPSPNVAEPNITITSRVVFTKRVNVGELPSACEPTPSTSTGTWTATSLSANSKEPLDEKAETQNSMPDSLNDPEMSEEFSISESEPEAEAEEYVRPRPCHPEYYAEQESVVMSTFQGWVPSDRHRTNVVQYTDRVTSRNVSQAYHGNRNYDYMLPQNAQMHNYIAPDYYGPPEGDTITPSQSLYCTEHGYRNYISHQMGNVNRMHPGHFDHNLVEDFIASERDQYHGVSSSSVNFSSQRANTSNFYAARPGSSFQCGNKPSSSVTTSSNAMAVPMPIHIDTMRPHVSSNSGNVGRTSLAKGKEDQHLGQLQAIIIKDTDSETETDESDSEGIDVDFQKKNTNRQDTDSDSDSSGSRDLVVQKPLRTYSRLSAGSEHSNTSPKQRSPPFQNSGASQHKENECKHFRKPIPKPIENKLEMLHSNGRKVLVEKSAISSVYQSQNNEKGYEADSRTDNSRSFNNKCKENHLNATPFIKGYDDNGKLVYYANDEKIPIGSSIEVETTQYPIEVLVRNCSVQLSPLIYTSEKEEEIENPQQTSETINDTNSPIIPERKMKPYVPICRIRSPLEQMDTEVHPWSIFDDIPRSTDESVMRSCRHKNFKKGGINKSHHLLSRKNIHKVTKGNRRGRPKSRRLAIEKKQRQAPKKMNHFGSCRQNNWTRFSRQEMEIMTSAKVVLERLTLDEIRMHTKRRFNVSRLVTPESALRGSTKCSMNIQSKATDKNPRKRYHSPMPHCAPKNSKFEEFITRQPCCVIQDNIHGIGLVLIGNSLNNNAAYPKNMNATPHNSSMKLLGDNCGMAKQATKDCLTLLTN